MNKAIIAAVAGSLAMGTMLVSVEEAGAVVCARGVYRAGCAGPHGAVAVRRAPVVVHRAPVRRAVIVR